MTSRKRTWGVEPPATDRARLAETALWRIQNAAETLDHADTLKGAGLIEYAAARIGTQADLARASGLTPQTVTHAKQRDKTSKSQKAAIMWALAKHELAL